MRLVVLWLALGVLWLWLAPVAHAQSPIFDPYTSLPQPGLSESTVLGDLNGDGALDLVVGKWDVNQVARTGVFFYLNDGQGRFTAARPVGSEQRAPSVALGDLNGDGMLDLVIGHSEAEHATILLNLGNNAFIPGPTLDYTPSQYVETRALGVADFNGDGALDLVIGDYGGVNHLFLNRNDGSGAFAPGVAIDPTLLYTMDLAVGDLNGDGAVDLVIGQTDHPNLVYLNKNDGSGTFGSAQSFGGVTPSFIASVAVGDLNGDNRLDLVTGHIGKAVVYLNDGSGIFPSGEVTCATPPVNVTCFSTVDTSDLALSDLDGDQALDIIVGANEQPSQFYINNGTGQFPTSTLLLNSVGVVGVKVGDLDGDSAPDLVMGNTGQLDQVYLNQGAIAFSHGQPFNVAGHTSSLTTGDLNGDGLLDLALSRNQQGQIYLGDGTGRFASPTLFGAPGTTDHVTLADLNGDKALDLISSGQSPGLVYFNDGTGGFTTTSVVCAAPPVNVRCYLSAGEGQALVTGDVDGNGALDLLVAVLLPNETEQLALYLNDGGGNFLPTRVVDNSIVRPDLGVGDLDNDGDLDLVVVNDDLTTPGWIYHNDGLGNFTAVAALGPIFDVSGVALGDLNGDTYLDLVVGRYSDQNQIYLNDGTGRFPSAFAVGGVADVSSLALGDLNGDRTLDIVFGNGYLSSDKQNSYFLNDGSGRAFRSAAFGNSYSGRQIALGDFNRDGALDLVSSNTVGLSAESAADEIYLNRNGLSSGLPNQPPAITVHRPLDTGDANFYSAAEIIQAGVITIPYRLIDQESETVGALQAFYSLNGGGHWLPALPTSSTPTAHLAASPSGVEHYFAWDTAASGFFGQSSNVVLRLEAHTQPNRPGALGQYHYPKTVAGLLQRASIAAVTFPFRMRGTQVRVVNEQQQPVNGAQVYRLLAGQSSGAQRFATGAGLSYWTDAQGYLQGRGALNMDDQLVALLPISTTHAFTLYYTSAAPTLTGLALQPVTQAGVQTLTVSAANPLVLFDLDITLEWDARNDDLFLEQLDSAIERSSNVLFDVSNGQMALGKVRIHQAKEDWVAADIVLYASNSIHPRASMGGVVITPTNEIGVSGVISNAYLPGQIRMGPNWDPFGQNQAELTEDWSRALAHELAHYLLFLPDNYLGIRDNLLHITNCRGSFMTNAHDAEGYSEFLTRSDWLDDCQQTVAQRLTGRTDWETILRFFPWLHAPAAAADLPGPSVLPLSVLQISHLPRAADLTSEPGQPAITLPARNYDLRDTEGQLLTVRQAQAYLFQSRGTSTLSDDSVIPLGSTGNGSDRIKVRGAALGDRLCVLAANQTPARLGCRAITAESGAIKLATVADWQPTINVSPITSRTLVITVTQATPLDKLNVQVLPAYGSPTGSAVITSPWATMQVVDPTNPVTFTQVITLANPAFEGFVRVWVPGDEPEDASEREALTQFFLSAAWGPPQSGFGGTDTRVWGPPQSGFGGADTRAWGANNRSLEAPVASGDGKVTIFNLNDILDETGVASLQTLASLPQVPLWLTPVGQGYRLVMKAEHTLTIAFHYLQREAPAGYEYTLNLYYSPDNGASWQRLPTLLDTEENLAAAQIPVNEQRGAGIYTLMATLEMPRLIAGWNQFAYPLPQARAVPVALASIAGSYTSVYHFDPTQEPRWQFYSTAVVQEQPALAGFVNDLSELTFGHSYWLYATATITPYLGVGGDQSVLAAVSAPGLELPPATLYGAIAVTETSSLGVGTVITALIDGKQCGLASVQTWQGQLVYKIQVAADTGNGCGAEGRAVTLAFAGKALATNIAWDNRQPSLLPLIVGNPGQRIFLPIIQR